MKYFCVFPLMPGPSMFKARVWIVQEEENVPFSGEIFASIPTNESLSFEAIMDMMEIYESVSYKEVEE